MNPKKEPCGLIEAAIIIIVIAILAGFAIPKYLDARDASRLNTARNFANGMAVASSINYTECRTGNTADCVKILNCSDFAILLPQKLPSDMHIILKPGTPFPTVPGTVAECQVIYGSQPLDFKAIVNP